MAAMAGAQPWATTLREPTAASRDDLLSVHSAQLVDRVLDQRDRHAQIDADTGVSPGSVRAALLAVGAARQAATVAMNDPAAPRHMCLVRPPGHHAQPDRAMGFCLFSNLALGVEAARAAGANRVLVVDWDVHHGNGTQAAFYDRDDVLVIDVHQDRHYPGTGALDEIGRGDGEGATINVPVPAGFGDAQFGEIFARVVGPAARRFSPDIIFVAAGFDAHRDDPLGDLELTATGFGALAARLGQLARELCSGRLVATLEGGYDLDALEACVGACAQVWSSEVNEPASDAPTMRSAAADRVVAAVVDRHPRWLVDRG